MPTLQTEETPSPPNKGIRAIPQGPEDQRGPLLQHLEELRKRVWICIVAVIFGTAASFHWAGRIIEWLKKPAGEALPRLAFFSPAEGILAYLKVAVMTGFVLAMPILLYETWAFLRPGLSGRERRFGLYFVGWGSLLFSGGVAFAYWALLPVSLRFLLSFGNESLVPVISIGRYLEFATAVLLAAGFVFELPLGVFLLTRLGFITPQALLRHWRAAFVAMAVAAAALTPTPDAINLMLLMAPLLLLYAISVGVSWLAAPRRARAK